MKIIKNIIDEYKYEIILTNDVGNKFKMHYAGGDLYWTMLNYCENNSFYISENDLLYVQLKQLFDKIEQNNQYCKLLNNNCFEWISEAYGIPEESNKLIIIKNNNSFIIKFFQNPNRKFNIKDICSVCFCLSGSRYQDIAAEFSMMFYNLKEYENCKTKVLR